MNECQHNIYIGNIGQRIRKLRNSLNLTQDEFAKRLGLTQSFICNVEKDRTKLTIDHVISIVNIFEIDAGVLLQSDDQQKSVIIHKEPLNFSYMPSSRESAIKRIIKKLGLLPYEGVIDVLKYVEEKRELMYLQALGRGRRLPEDISD